MHEKSLDSLEEVTIYINTDAKDCYEDSLRRKENEISHGHWRRMCIC